MPTMGRKPSKNLNLPAGLRARQQRSGKTYYYYDTGGKPRREIPLGSDYTEAVRKWAALEQAEPTRLHALITLKRVSDRFIRDVLPEKAARTQKDYLTGLQKLYEFFGEDAPIDQIRPAHVRQFLDYRKQSTFQANREKALLSTIYNHARGWGLTDQPNPCIGIKGYPEPSRKVYVEDDVFAAVYQQGCQPLKDALDLAYLCGQRPADTRKMSETDIRDGKLSVNQNKTGAKISINIVGKLQTVIARILERKRTYKVRSLALICSETGAPLSYDALWHRFDKARAAAITKNPVMAESLKQYQFRDLRAKAGTDKVKSGGSVRAAQKLLGHAHESTTEIYIRAMIGDTVDPTE